MCKTCAGIGKVLDLNIHAVIHEEHTYEEGIFQLPAFGPGNYYWKIYRRPDLFDVNKNGVTFPKRSRISFFTEAV